MMISSVASMLCFLSLLHVIVGRGIPVTVQENITLSPIVAGVSVEPSAITGTTVCTKTGIENIVSHMQCLNAH